MTAREKVRDELIARLDEVAAAVVRSIVTEMPAYTALSRPQLAEVRSIAEWGISRVLQLWVEGGSFSPADIQRFRGIGAARAQDGRPLPGVLRAYRLAGTQILDHVEHAGRSRLSVPDVLALSRLWMTTIDTLSEALETGHAMATDRAAGDRPLAVSQLVEDLLLGRRITQAGLADRLRELGLSLEPRVMLVVLRARGTNTEMSPGALHALMAEAVHDPTSSILPRVHDDLGAAIVPVDTEIGSQTLLRRHWRGCAMTELKVTDLPRAFRLASHLLVHAPARAFAQRALLEEPDAQVVALLTGQRDGDPDRLRTLLLHRFGGAAGRHLVEGLVAYLDAGSATEAATALHIHPQTMRYRLGRIRELTGRDPRQAWDRLVLEATLLGGLSTEPA